MPVIDYRALAQRSPLIFGGVLVSLVAVLLFGEVAKGSRRWIDVGMRLQPSEFTRLGLALILAMLYGDARRSARSLGELLLGAGVLALPVALILLQPDLGHGCHLVPGVRRCRLHGRAAHALGGGGAAAGPARVTRGVDVWAP